MIFFLSEAKCSNEITFLPSFLLSKMNHLRPRHSLPLRLWTPHRPFITTANTTTAASLLPTQHLRLETNRISKSLFGTKSAATWPGSTLPLKQHTTAPATFATTTTAAAAKVSATAAAIAALEIDDFLYDTDVVVKPKQIVKKKEKEAEVFPLTALIRKTRRLIHEWKPEEAVQAFEQLPLPQHLDYSQGIILKEMLEVCLSMGDESMLRRVLKNVEGKILQLRSYLEVMEAISLGYKDLSIIAVDEVSAKITLDPFKLLNREARDYFVRSMHMLVLERISEVAEGRPKEWWKAKGTGKEKNAAGSRATLKFAEKLGSIGSSGMKGFAKGDVVAMTYIDPDTGKRLSLPGYGEVTEGTERDAIIDCFLPPEAVNRELTFEVAYLVTGVTHPRMIMALTHLCQGKGPSEEITKLLLAPGSCTAETNQAEKSLVRPKNLGTSSHLQLNESQLKAVESASAKRITLVHGPPGTGKTKTAAAIVHHLLLQDPDPTQGISKQQPKKQILVVAGSNKAADNIYSALRGLNIKAIRIGWASLLCEFSEAFLNYFFDLLVLGKTRHWKRVCTSWPETPWVISTWKRDLILCVNV